MTMTLESAIKHCEEVAEENEKFCFKKNGKGGYFNEDTDWNNKKCAKEHRQLAGWLKELKQLRIQTRWIPCSERLPEDYVDVLVWFEYFRYGDYNCMYAAHGIGNYSKEYNSWTINHETGWKDLHVFAWMPLPEPYKEESEGKE